VSHLPETIPVRPAHRFDEIALFAYLERTLDGFRRPAEIRQFSGGQSNPTFAISTKDGKYVVRKKPPGKLLPSAHAVDREYRVMKALGAMGVPVPQLYLLCEDESIIGTSFYVMDYLAGRVFRDPRLPQMTSSDRTAIYDSMNLCLAKIHTADLEALGLTDYGKPGNYFARQISRWSRNYLAAETTKIEPVDQLIKWLPENIPGGDQTSVVHGDFRLDNMIFHSKEPRVLAILDWELSTLGHPLADLAYNCLPYYLTFGASGGLASGKQIPGIPSEQKYVATYCHRTASKIDRWNFYLAFSLFRSASIAQGVYKRALDGNASSVTGIELGAHVAETATKAWELAMQCD
tara:strand:- start:24855 stop:25898 length:1044 start_codon:yes stop_codon:yes gene_type:complete